MFRMKLVSKKWFILIDRVIKRVVEKNIFHRISFNILDNNIGYNINKHAFIIINDKEKIHANKMYEKLYNKKYNIYNIENIKCLQINVFNRFSNNNINNELLKELEYIINNLFKNNINKVYLKISGFKYIYQFRNIIKKVLNNTNHNVVLKWKGDICIRNLKISIENDNLKGIYINFSILKCIENVYITLSKNVNNEFDLSNYFNPRIISIIIDYKTIDFNLFIEKVVNFNFKEILVKISDVKEKNIKKINKYIFVDRILILTNNKNFKYFDKYKKIVFKSDIINYFYMNLNNLNKKVLK